MSQASSVATLLEENVVDSVSVYVEMCRISGSDLSDIELFSLSGFGSDSGQIGDIYRIIISAGYFSRQRGCRNVSYYNF